MRASHTVVPARPSALPDQPVPSRSGRPARLVALLVALGLASAATLATAAPAGAATIDRAITNVTISPTSPTQTSQLSTNISWCVPSGTRSGDTFTLTLPSRLKNLPTGFSLRDPATTSVVAYASISSARPAVVTFASTAYAQSHVGVCGTSFIRSDFDGTTTPTGVRSAFTSTTGDGRTFTTVVTPTGVFGNHTQPIKYGTWARADQGRTVPTDFLVWHVDTPVGPFASAGTVDRVPAGQTWRYDCSTLTTLAGTIAANGDLGTLVRVVPVAKSCTPTQVAVSWPAASANREFRMEIATSIPAATGSSTAQRSFSNTAAVKTTVGGRTKNFTASATLQQATAGSLGNGSALAPSVRILKGDSRGNRGDSAATSAKIFSNGTAKLIYMITNTGNDALTNLHVADKLVLGGGVSRLTCDFRSIGGPASGTVSTGTLKPGASITCSAALTGVPQKSTHRDIGYVSATGVASGKKVAANDSYYARPNLPVAR